MKFYRIVVETWGEDEEDAIQTAGHYMSIGYQNRVVVSIEETNNDEDQE